MKCDVLGMTETRGLMGSIEATDAIVKATNVALLGKEVIGGDLVTVMVQEDIGAVKVVTDAGVTVVGRMGELVSVHVILWSHGGVEAILLGARTSGQNITEQNIRMTTKEDSIYERRQCNSKL